MTDILIKKYLKREDVSNLGAFTREDTVRFELLIPRKLGVSTVVMKTHADNGCKFERELRFCRTDWVVDVYFCELDFFRCVENAGPIFYSFELNTCDGKLFLNSVNNVDGELSKEKSAEFHLLIYGKNFKTPDFAKGGVMYHIFVDRFRRGEGKTELREDCLYDTDWENGIPQYAEDVGGYVENNVFFGGNLYGVCEKLDYLKTLGVNMIYLSPIFEARSNHKYDTGDYERTDSGFGGDDALKALIKDAKDRGIHVILDGVFNHTGDDSRYFDKYFRYGGGAYSDPRSEYHDWYIFEEYPDKYESWWGIPILPRLDHENIKCRSYFTANDGVAQKYIKMGVSGWRLDVADELTDDFLEEFRESVKSTSCGDAIIIGEVWENAATKIAYGKRRRYFLGKQLDSVMNYPVRNAIIDFIRDRNATSLYNTLTEIYSSYPKCVCDVLMNIVGTHDTERILTVLAGDRDTGYQNSYLATLKMNARQRERGITLLKLASVIQYTVYGFPSLYYGDETGLEGYRDPFCRRPYPWGREETVLLEHYKKLGEIRRTHKVFSTGSFEMIYCSDSCIAYTRENGNEKITVAVNRGDFSAGIGVCGKFRDLLTLREYDGNVSVPSDTALILESLD